MKSLTFYSNYFNHHQQALCDAWFQLLGDGFTFVETQPMEAFRADMGWGEGVLPAYVCKAHENAALEEEAMALGGTSDIVIIGSAPERYIKRRLQENKLTFRYTERPLKEGFIKFFIPRLTKKYYELHIRNKNKPLYVLGASAYAAADYKKMGCYGDKCYKFGYFPQVIKHDIDSLLRQKQTADGIPEILWAGRLLQLKRADLLIRAAGRLLSEGYRFRLHFVGEGEQKEHLQKLLQQYKLDGITKWQPFVSPMEVRALMERANILTMTSNFLEGWGSVIYEALNAGCAVVASHACGSAPWLVTHEKTGLLFQSGSASSLYEQLKRLLERQELCMQLGKQAYEQMESVWNPQVAAESVLHLAERLYAGLDTDIPEGPCSKALCLKNNWYP